MREYLITYEEEKVHCNFNYKTKKTEIVNQDKLRELVNSKKVLITLIQELL